MNSDSSYCPAAPTAVTNCSSSTVVKYLQKTCFFYLFLFVCPDAHLCVHSQSWPADGMVTGSICLLLPSSVLIHTSKELHESHSSQMLTHKMFFMLWSNTSTSNPTRWSRSSLLTSIWTGCILMSCDNFLRFNYYLKKRFLFVFSWTNCHDGTTAIHPIVHVSQFDFAISSKCIWGCRFPL